MNNINKPFDLASFLHLFNNIILGIIMKNNYVIAFLLGILWEIFEKFFVKKNMNKLNKHKFTKKYEYLWNETLLNQFVDIIINMIGYYIGNKIFIKNLIILS